MPLRRENIKLPDLPAYSGTGSVVHFDATGRDLNRLAVLLALVETEYVAYMISEKDNRVILFKYLSDSDKENPKVSKFMTPQPFDVVAAQVFEWLKTANYGEEPDHDGSNSKGYRVCVDDIWGHVYLEKPENGKFASSSWSAACAIEPFWLQYGK